MINGLFQPVSVINGVMGPKDPPQERGKEERVKGWENGPIKQNGGNDLRRKTNLLNMIEKCKIAKYKTI